MAEDKIELGAFEQEIGSASAALRAIVDDCTRGGQRIETAFERAGRRIASALSRAALEGEVSFKRMSKTILEELAKVALDRIFPSGAGKRPFFGARAGGGSVNAGGAYLVGERGPELFVPRQAGDIAASAGAVNVHFHLGAGADASAITRHQGQIAAAVARAVAYGRRNL